MIASLLRALLVFGLVGPLIGLACVAIQDPAGIAFRPALLLAMALFAYVFGLIPAFLTGLVAWTMRYRLPWYLGAPACSVIGTLTASLFLAPTPYTAQSLGEGLQIALVPGGVAGLVCGFLYFWPPNKSFKPSPLRGLGAGAQD